MRRYSWAGENLIKTEFSLSSFLHSRMSFFFHSLSTTFDDCWHLHAYERVALLETNIKVISELSLITLASLTFFCVNNFHIFFLHFSIHSFTIWKNYFDAADKYRIQTIFLWAILSIEAITAWKH